MKPAGLSAAAWTAAANLVVDHATAEILRAFQAAGVPAVLLKGPSIARWLYAAGEPRTYVDSDLLVRPSDEATAGRVLAGLGYVQQLDERRMPAWWRHHATTWKHVDQGWFVDLHHTLQGVSADGERAWAVLCRETDTLEVAGFTATVLSIPARALYVALTAAQGPLPQGMRSDLERALEQVGEDTWRRAAALAIELDATDWLLAGLARRPEGEALATRLGLGRELSVETALRSAGAPGEALTVEQIARARGLWQPIEIVIRKLFPPVTYLRHWSSLATRGRRGLVLAYGYRVLWVAKTAVPALVAWWRARRQVIRRPP